MDEQVTPFLPDNKSVKSLKLLTTFNTDCKTSKFYQLLYGGKFWWWETLANLANDHKFANPAQIFTIQNNHTWSKSVEQVLLIINNVNYEVFQVCTHELKIS